MSSLIKTTQFLNHSSLLVACAATALSAEFQWLSFGSIDVIYTLLAFTSTLVAYSFLKTDQPFDGIVWKRLTATLFILNLFFVDRITLIFLLGAGLIVLLYSSHTLRGTSLKLPFELRKHPVLKTAAIASTWILISAVVPFYALTDNESFGAPGILYLTISFWLLTAAFSIAGDTRDAIIDTNVIISWPAWIGTSATKFLMIVLLFLSALFFFLSQGRAGTFFILPLVVFTVISAISVVVIQPEKNWHTQTSWIDGLIIFHFVLMYYFVR